MTLNEYYQRYETIMSIPIPPIERDKMLSNLMIELEAAFEIPTIKDQSWEKEYADVHTLYFKVSSSRSF